MLAALTLLLLATLGFLLALLLKLFFLSLHLLLHLLFLAFLLLGFLLKFLFISVLEDKRHSVGSHREIVGSVGL